MTWNLDLAHSTIGFAVRHMMISKVRGSFARFEATLSLDEADLTRSKVEATIDVASLTTGDDKRDEHLRSADFFDAEKHPKIQFRSTSISKQGDDRYRLTGELTIRGTTRTVELDAVASGPAKDPWGNQRLGFSLTGEIDREDFGLTWNQALETGGVLVGKKVEIAADIETIAG